MRLWPAALISLLLVARTASAQTSSLLDPLATIQQFESGGLNIPQQTGATNSTASGLYQITNTTENTVIAPNTGLPVVGPGTPYPDGVMGLSPEQQEEAAAYLYETEGFSPWTCSGCNAQLAAYVAQEGGSGTFALTPAEQATLTGGGNGLTVSTVDDATPANGTTTTGGPAAVPTGTLNFRPFTWLQNALFNTITADIANAVTQVDNLAYAPLTTLLVIAAAVSGIGLMLHRQTVDTFAYQFLRWAFLVTILTPGAAELQNYVVQPIEQNSTNGSPANAATVLDAVFDTAVSNAYNVWEGLGWSPGRLVFVGILLSLIVIVTGLALGIIYLGVALITMASLIMICLFPVVALALLFESTMKFLRGYIDIVAGLLLTLLAIDIVLAIYMGVLVNLDTAFVSGNSNYTKSWRRPVAMPGHRRPGRHDRLHPAATRTDIGRRRRRDRPRCPLHRRRAGRSRRCCRSCCRASSTRWRSPPRPRLRTAPAFPFARIINVKDRIFYYRPHRLGGLREYQRHAPADGQS